MLIDHSNVVADDAIRCWTEVIELRLAGQRSSQGEPAPEGWEEWVCALFPRHVEHEFTDRHREMWEWGWRLDSDSEERPFVAIWPRGGGKTTSAELLTAALGVTGRRRYAWYVSETQDKADNNIRNLGSLLESESVGVHYPAHSERMLTKYGHSKGWTSQRLRTAGGFTVDGIGLDTAQRGLKVEDQRPDLIILDDVDGKHDTLATTAKKIQTITTSILPAGSTNVAVLCVQNLIIANGFFTRMVDGRADYLSDRIVSGPHPAIEGLTWQWSEERDGSRAPVITGGTATWAGQAVEVCQRMMRRFGPIAFLKECQHKVKELAQGIVLSSFDIEKNGQHWTDAEIRDGIRNDSLTPYAGIDFGLWRFAFLLIVVDRAGRAHVIDEYFSQRETLGTRAKAIDAMLTRYGITKLRVFGDPANPTDRLEINAALEKGWRKAGREHKPKWRVGAAVKEKGSRLTGPDRINEMYESRSLIVRRGIGTGHRWFLGMNASSEGDPEVGSRFLWEQENWSYPDPLEGRAQDQDPDDNTADGADMMAAFRYVIMSWLKPPKKKERPKKPRDRNRDEGYERMQKKIRDQRARGVAA